MSSQEENESFSDGQEQEDPDLVPLPLGQSASESALERKPLLKATRITRLMAGYVEGILNSPTASHSAGLDRSQDLTASTEIETWQEGDAAEYNEVGIDPTAASINPVTVAAAMVANAMKAKDPTETENALNDLTERINTLSICSSANWKDVKDSIEQIREEVTNMRSEFHDAMENMNALLKLLAQNTKAQER